MKVHPTTPDAIKLLLNGSLVLAQIEHNGFRIDTDYLQKTIQETSQKIKEQETLLREDKTYEVWRRRFGVETNLGSDQQMAVLFFKILDNKPQEFTKTGKPKVDEAALSLVGTPFAKGCLKLKKLKKIKTTYLEGILRESIDGFVHPSFSLHTVTSLRGSATNPNLQNIPNRKGFLASVVRPAFIAREGRQLVEIDFVAVEVRMSCPYHHDPNLIAYVSDKSGNTDMHRDTAIDCLFLSKEFFLKHPKEGKAIRNWVKNRFVFPQFYGDYYAHSAHLMWRDLRSDPLPVGASGPLMKDWLKQHGIKGKGACDPTQKPQQGTLEYHLKKAESVFWDQRFKTYTAWKKKFWERFTQEGAFNTHVGFRVEGLLTKNQVNNFPIQSSAFHALLWCLIEIQKELTKRRMKTLLVSEIHDCLVADVVVSELPEFVGICKEVMTKRLLKHWPWINVPLDVEVEVCPIGGTWYDKETVKM